MKFQKRMLAILFLIVFAASAHASSTVLYQNDFNSMGLEGFVQDGGTWSVVSGSLHGVLSDGDSIGTYVPLNFATMTPDENIMISFSVVGISGDDLRSFFFATDTPSVHTYSSGYRAFTRPFTSGGFSSVAKWNAGGFINGAPFADGTSADVNVTINNSNTFTFYLNGVAIGTQTQSTYTSGSYIGFAAENNAPGAVMEWDNIKILDCKNFSCGGPGAPTSLAANILYPNAQGLRVIGTQNIDFNFVDSSFSTAKKYDFNLAVHRVDNGLSTSIVKDANAYNFCSNMDTNLTIKDCLFNYAFQASLIADVNYIMDLNIASDTNRIMVTANNSFYIPSNRKPQLQILYPNSPGLFVAGVNNFDFNFTDADFNVSAPYDFNIAVHRTDTNATTAVTTNANAFTYCSNMDTNTTTKDCLFSYNFFTLATGINWLADVNLSDSKDKNISHAQFSFQISQNSLLVDYNNYGTDSNTGRKYVNELDYNATYSCNGGSTGVFERFIDSLNDFNEAAICDTTTRQLFNSYMNPSNGHNFLIHFKLFDSIANQTNTTSDFNFFSDITNPIAHLTNTPLASGFGPTIGDVNLNLQCNDTVSPKIDFNIIKVSADTSFLSGRFDANSTHRATIPLDSGTEIFRGECTDLAGNQGVDFNTVNVQVNCFKLVDETSGVPLTLVDINGFGGLTATSYRTHAVYNFKTSGGNPNVCFNGTMGDTIRFDMNYSDGTQLFREFNQDILTHYDQNIAVCAADLQSFFEQDFTSARNTPIILRHQISQCFNSADYTKYAESDALSLRAFTIVGPYSMETFDSNGNKIVLSQINGGTPSGIQVDVLKFKLGEVPVNLTTDFLGVSLVLPAGGGLDSNTLKLYYVNNNNDNVSVRLQILDNSSTIFDYNELANPNLFVVYFDHTLVPIDGNVLQIIITKIKTDGSTVSETKYVSLNGIIQGAKGVFGSGEPLGAILAILIFIFGFTMVAPKFALGWVGIIISLISLAVLSLTSQAWYIIWLQAVFLIIALYLSMTYKENAGVT